MVASERSANIIWDTYVLSQMSPYSKTTLEKTRAAAKKELNQMSLSQKISRISLNGVLVAILILFMYTGVGFILSTFFYTAGLTIIAYLLVAIGFIVGLFFGYRTLENDISDNVYSAKLVNAPKVDMKKVNERLGKEFRVFETYMKKGEYDSAVGYVNRLEKNYTNSLSLDKN